MKKLEGCHSDGAILPELLSLLRTLKAYIPHSLSFSPLTKIALSRKLILKYWNIARVRYCFDEIDESSVSKKKMVVRFVQNFSSFRIASIILFQPEVCAQKPYHRRLRMLHASSNSGKLPKPCGKIHRIFWLLTYNLRVVGCTVRSQHQPDRHLTRLTIPRKASIGYGRHPPDGYYRPVRFSCNLPFADPSHVVIVKSREFVENFSSLNKLAALPRQLVKLSVNCKACRMVRRLAILWGGSRRRVHCESFAHYLLPVCSAKPLVTFSKKFIRFQKRPLAVIDGFHWTNSVLHA
ncbi:hypothetical protein AVEN_214086-1 [Araneus ventricosus]|uniref:Uncharacterized protein n=1 Tax=Araneus ventricosus TaxID=182803 RepID=A0A4Y2NPA7_ARAVE|nr:hypothetical protein AVEN_214086-1 [Araneus ventricosus]